jgi:integrase
LAPRTINHVHSVVFQTLKQAKIWGVIRDNVAEAVKPPPVPDQELPILQPDRARELLEALRGHPFYLIAALALATGMGKAPPDSQVLATFNGKPQSPNAVTKSWPRAVAAIGMPGVTLHSLRHTHASMLIASGMDVLTISRRLGHGSPTITLRVYGHLIHGADDRAAQIIDAAFGSKMVADSGKKP